MEEIIVTGLPPQKKVHSPKTNGWSLKMMVSNRNLQASRGLFSGAMWVFWGVFDFIMGVPKLSIQKMGGEILSWEFDSVKR